MRQENLQNTRDHALGSGLGAKVYVAEWGGQTVVKKIFDPASTARVVYQMLRFKKHPYTADYNQAVISAAFELRRVAHRISRAFGSDIEVVDALAVCDGELGFYSPFIKGHAYNSSDPIVKEHTDLLEHHFQRIGLPIWSFGGWQKDFRRKGNVLVGNDRKIHVVDYEAGIPFFSREGIVGFDDVDVLRFEKFLDLAGPALQSRLGDDEYTLLFNSWQRYIQYNTYWKDEKEKSPVRKAQILRDAVAWRSLVGRVAMWQKDGQVTPEEAENLRRAVQTNKDLLTRIVPHMMVHFATTGLPTGGFLLRPTYTGVMRLISEVTKHFDDTKDKKIEIHNLTVAVTSAISLSIPGVPFASFPALGYLAYLTNVTKAPLGYLVLDNIAYRASGKGLKEFFRDAGRGKAKSIIEWVVRAQRNRVGDTLVTTTKKSLGNIISEQAIDAVLDGLTDGGPEGN